MQAVAVGVDASNSAWQHYGGGVLNDFSVCTANANHAVVVVGYNRTEGTCRLSDTVLLTFYMYV